MFSFWASSSSRFSIGGGNLILAYLIPSSVGWLVILRGFFLFGAGNSAHFRHLLSLLFYTLMMAFLSAAFWEVACMFQQQVVHILTLIFHISLFQFLMSYVWPVFDLSLNFCVEVVYKIHEVFLDFLFGCIFGTLRSRLCNNDQQVFYLF